MSYWELMAPKYYRFNNEINLGFRDPWDGTNRPLRTVSKSRTYTMAAHINVKSSKETAINARIVRYTKNHKISNVKNAEKYIL